MATLPQGTKEAERPQGLMVHGEQSLTLKL